MAEVPNLEQRKRIRDEEEEDDDDVEVTPEAKEKEKSKKKKREEAPKEPKTEPKVEPKTEPKVGRESKDSLLSYVKTDAVSTEDPFIWTKEDTNFGRFFLVIRKNPGSEVQVKKMDAHNIEVLIIASLQRDEMTNLAARLHDEGPIPQSVVDRWFKPTKKLVVVTSILQLATAPKLRFSTPTLEAYTFNLFE